MKKTASHVTSTLLAVPLIAASLRYITDFWLLSFIYSFQLHIAVACMLGGIAVFILFRGRMPFLIMAWSAALFVHGAIMERELSSKGNVAGNTETFRLLSFNIMQRNFRGATQIRDLVLESGADAVFVMEAQPLLPFLGKLQETYPWRVGCGEGTPRCDLLVLSRHPLRNTAVHSLSDLRPDRFVTTVAEWKGKDINLAAIHLTKPYYDYYHDLELWNAQQILSRIGGPLILAGDFNSSGLAPDMQRFLRTMGMVSADRREPATWPVRAGYFGIPIDHIYTRAPGFIPKLERIQDNLGSNHFGLVGDIAIPD